MPFESYHQSLMMQNFTAFQAIAFEFVPGINVFVGENGTGKTHVMKTLYAVQLTQSREQAIDLALNELFQTRDIGDIARFGIGSEGTLSVSGVYGNHAWSYWIQPFAHPRTTNMSGPILNTETLKAERPVFIPAIDMMGHTKGFTEAYAEVRLDFDLTCRDIVNLLRLERKNGTEKAHLSSDISKPFARLLKGEIERDDAGRFYLVTKQGRLPMPMVAEGLRKIATLVQLERNGWLSPGATLFWDEPEVNLNPVLMGEVVGAILALSRQGVQVILATHSYVILKELELQANQEDQVRYFSFQPGENGTTVNATEEFSLIAPNPILDQYASLYDRELTRSTGRNRQRERVR